MNLRLSKNKRILATGMFGLSLLFLCLLILVPSPAHAFEINPLYKVLQEDSNIVKVWQSVRDMVNVILIVVLIFIAFANILRINLNNYAIKKFLPALIFGAILANFSYFICQVLVDLSNVAMSLLMNGSNSSVKDGQIGVAAAFDFTTQTVDAKFLWKTLVYTIAEFAGAIVIFALSFLFFIRNYVIYFLVALSPLAFMATVLPESKTVFKQWMSLFTKWTFMPIVSIFWLWLGGIWYTSGLNPTKTGGDFNAAMLALVFAGVCYYLAITTPFKMGGPIMTSWGNAGKKVWGATGGAAWRSTGGAAIGAGKNYVGQQYSNYKNFAKDWAKDKIPIVKSINNSIGRGNIRQKGIDAIFEKRQFEREKEALGYEIESGKWDDPKHKEFRKRLKSMEQKYFLDDEKDPSYANKSVEQLRDKLIYIRDDDGTVRHATDQEILSGKEGLQKFNGEALNLSNATMQEKVAAFSEASASAVELTSRARTTSRNLATTVDGMRPSDVVDGYDRIDGEIVNAGIGKLDHRTMGSSNVEAANGALTRGGIEAARAVANGGVPSSETTLSEETINAMAEMQREHTEKLLDEAEHETRVEAAIVEKLHTSDAVALNMGKSGDDAVNSDLKEIGELSNQGLKDLYDKNIDAALEAAKKISGTFSTQLKLLDDDAEKQKAELERIFTSAGKVVSDLGAKDISQVLAEYDKNPDAWKQARENEAKANIPLQAEIGAANQVFANQIPRQTDATIDDLRKSLEGHLDVLIESNEGVQQAIKNNPTSIDTNGLKSSLTNVINASITEQLKNTAPAQKDPTSQIREAMVGALTDVRVNKTLAGTFRNASKDALKSAP